MNPSPRETQKCERLRSYVGDRKFKRCLDIGCGNGFVTKFFVDCCEEIYCLDKPEKIWAIQQVLPNLHVATIDFEKTLPTTKFLQKKFGVSSFDLVLFTDVIYYLPRTIWAGMVKAIHDVLEPEGLLLMSRHTPKHSLRLSERLDERALFETADDSLHYLFWLLKEEYFIYRITSSWWIMQVWTLWPPSNMAFAPIPYGEQK